MPNLISDTLSRKPRAATPSAPAGLKPEEWKQRFDALPDCEGEDSTNCKWNAKTMGNGKGKSFININGVTHYEDGTSR